MEVNNIFSFSRLSYLLKRHYVLNFKGLLISFSAIAGVLAIIGALSSLSGTTFNHEVFVVLFYVILFIGGYILSSGIFQELHRPERSIHFLTLPASNFEKLLSAWLNTTILYMVFAVISFYISYFISSLMALWWFEIPLEWFSLFEAGFLKIVGIYIITQSVFFFGAVYFKGYNFLKIVLSLFVLSLFHSICQTLFGAVAFQEIFHLLKENRNIDEIVSAPGLEEYVKTVLIPLVKALFFYVMPVFFLTMSYLRIKEREV